MIAFGFGLVHGFGFSFALRETLQFAGSHLLTSLLSFNIGVELGQLLVLLLLIPVLEALFRFVVAERMGTIILSALVAHTGWHWMMERGAILGRFQPPAFDAAFLAGALRWLIAILLLAGAIRAVPRMLRRRFRRQQGRTRRTARLHARSLVNSDRCPCSTSSLWQSVPGQAPFRSSGRATHLGPPQPRPGMHRRDRSS